MVFNEHKFLDKFGTEIKVGDIMIYVVSGRSATVSIYEVHAFDKAKIKAYEITSWVETPTGVPAIQMYEYQTETTRDCTPPEIEQRVKWIRSSSLSKYTSDALVYNEVKGKLNEYYRYKERYR